MSTEFNGNGMNSFVSMYVLGDLCFAGKGRDIPVSFSLISSLYALKWPGYQSAGFRSQ